MNKFNILYEEIMNNMPTYLGIIKVFNYNPYKKEFTDLFSEETNVILKDNLTDDDYEYFKEITYDVSKLFADFYDMELNDDVFKKVMLIDKNNNSLKKEFIVKSDDLNNVIKLFLIIS